MEKFIYLGYDDFINKLKSLYAGDSFCVFSEKIIKTNKKIIGVRTPVIKKIIKKIDDENAEKIFSDYKGFYYEEVLIKAILIGRETDFFKAKEALESFYKDFDNWAIVDLLAGYISFINKENKDLVFEYFRGLMLCEEEFKVRFGIVCLMKYFLCQEYLNKTLEAIKCVKCGKYYVDMGIAWLLSEVMIKFPQKAIKNMQKIIKNKHFNKFIVNKAIQKAIESYRISKELKIKLKELKIKC